MSDYSYEMNGEGGRVLLSDGWHNFMVVAMELTTSKSGNEMFKVTIEQPETGAVEDVYCITAKGKRWALKQLLSAVGIEGDVNGVYHFDIPDVVGKSVEAKNVQEDNVYINRDGDEVKEKRNKIQGFRKATTKATV